jgi:hypothetical protein
MRLDNKLRTEAWLKHKRFLDDVRREDEEARLLEIERKRQEASLIKEKNRISRYVRGFYKI